MIKLKKKLEEQKEELKVLIKREQDLLSTLNVFKELQKLRKKIKNTNREVKKLEMLKRKKELEGLNDAETNIIHTRQGLQRRIEAGVVMSQGNFMRLVDAFVYFANYSNKSLPILDIGTREGWFLKFLLKVGYENVQGIEISPEAVILAKSEKLSVVEMDVRKMLAENMFGTITAIHVLEHVSNPDKVVDVIYNALVPNGILYLEVPLELNPVAVKSAHFSNFPEPKNLFALFDKTKWKLLKHKIVIMNAAGSKRNCMSVFKKGIK